jgi:YfiH family protein
MSGLSPAGPAPALPPEWIVPDWPVPEPVRAFITTRAGGVSRGPWGAGEQGGMNVGMGSGDEAESVARNRELLNRFLPAAPRWLALCHGGDVVPAESVGSRPVRADASTAITPGVVCCVTVADCLPVLLTDRSGTVVAAAHAGWRGLAAGIVQATVLQMRDRAPRPLGEIDAFLGPSIGAGVYEVGGEVLVAMRRTLPHAEAAFRACGDGKWLADLPALARQALAQVGVQSVYGGPWCTLRDPARFYSYRRDRVTGRHAALIWLQPGS